MFAKDSTVTAWGARMAETGALNGRLAAINQFGAGVVKQAANIGVNFGVQIDPATLLTPTEKAFWKARQAKLKSALKTGLKRAAARGDEAGAARLIDAVQDRARRNELMRMRQMTNRAYREQMRAAAKRQPFAIGVRRELATSHKVMDYCEAVVATDMGLGRAVFPIGAEPMEHEGGLCRDTLVYDTEFWKNGGRPQMYQMPKGWQARSRSMSWNGALGKEANGLKTRAEMEMFLSRHGLGSAKPLKMVRVPLDRWKAQGGLNWQKSVVRGGVAADGTAVSNLKPDVKQPTLIETLEAEEAALKAKMKAKWAEAEAAFNRSDFGGQAMLKAEWQEMYRAHGKLFAKLNDLKSAAAPVLTMDELAVQEAMTRAKRLMQKHAKKAAAGEKFAMEYHARYKAIVDSLSGGGPVPAKYAATLKNIMADAKKAVKARAAREAKAKIAKELAERRPKDARAYIDGLTGTKKSLKDDWAKRFGKAGTRINEGQLSQYIDDLYEDLGLSSFGIRVNLSAKGVTPAWAHAIGGDLIELSPDMTKVLLSGPTNRRFGEAVQALLHEAVHSANSIATGARVGYHGVGVMMEEGVVEGLSRMYSNKLFSTGLTGVYEDFVAETTMRAVLTGGSPEAGLSWMQKFAGRGREARDGMWKQAGSMMERTGGSTLKANSRGVFSIGKVAHPKVIARLKKLGVKMDDLGATVNVRETDLVRWLAP